MQSFQNLSSLQELYRMKSLGVEFIDAIDIQDNENQNIDLPQNLNELADVASSCHLCDLSKSRNSVLFGAGKQSAKVLFIANYPTSSEDESGEFFSGRAGALLTKMIENVLKIPKESIYITNHVKCKPLAGERIKKDELMSCKSYLQRQLELVKPKVVVTLGPDSYRYFSSDDSAFDTVRGSRIKTDNYTLVPTLHPSFLLRNPTQKKVAYADLLTIKSLL